MADSFQRHLPNPLTHMLAGAAEAMGFGQSRGGLGGLGGMQPQQAPQPGLSQDAASSPNYATVHVGGGRYGLVPTVVNGKRISEAEATVMSMSGQLQPVEVYESFQDAQIARKVRQELGM